MDNSIPTGKVSVSQLADDPLGNPILSKFYKSEAKKSNSKLKLPPEKYDEFLSSLQESGGYITRAAARYGVHKRTVYTQMKRDKAFAVAIRDVQEMFKKKQLDDLEDFSLKNAMNPKNVSERLFHLKAMDPAKYRDRGIRTATQVNVTVAGMAIKDRAKEIERREKLKNVSDAG
tara:strand:- start:2704 stop:3225 length:522 start_codon:yes stop_codon:yes gene_type:complete